MVEESGSITMPPLPHLLLVDDDANLRRVLQYQLGELGEVTAVGSGAEALEALAGERFDLILSDVRMPPPDGLELLRQVRAQSPTLPFILLTAHGDIDMAVEAMQLGATDFLTKPFERERLQSKVERALRARKLEHENLALREALLTRHSFENLIGSSSAMRQLTDQMSRVALRDATVLILGESGTGKEVVARALHYAGPRRASNFVALNCAAIPATLLESELFGHTKGAYTGADAARVGRFQQADGGTLFLDEIGDMPRELQPKLLRAIQERVVEPIGGTRPIAINVRIIAATHRDLQALVQAGEFREDLFYRLNVVPLQLPPLRDRLEDIPLLVRHFLKCFGEAEVEIEPAALERLARHHWPGNVRELENAVERALALRLEPTRLAATDLLLPEPHAAESGEAAAGLYEIPDCGIVLDDVEKKLIQSAMRKTGNNQTRAAQLLGITRQTLIYRLNKYGLE
jgi:two-component system NtrC family response regulator